MFHEENWAKDNLKSLLAGRTESEAEKWIDFFSEAVVAQLFSRSEVEAKIETVRTFLRIKQILRRRTHAIQEVKKIIEGQSDGILFSLNMFEPLIDAIIKLGLATKASFFKELDEECIMKDVIPRQMACWAKDCISLLCAGAVREELINVQVKFVYEMVQTGVSLSVLCGDSGFTEEEFRTKFPVPI